MFTVALLLAACGMGNKYVIGIRWAENRSASLAGQTSVTESGLYFEDRYIRIGFVPVLNSTISFSLLNKTDSTIRVIWDEAAFIQIDGSTERVMHSGVRYIERDRPQPPSVVPPGARLDDIILPTSNVYYISGQYGGWRTHDIIPQSLALDFDGYTIGVLLPLDIGGSRRDYTFYFDIVVREAK